MISQEDIRHGRHCVFKLYVHLVFVTKYRRDVFTKKMLGYMKVILKKVCDDFDCKLTEFDGETNHIHLLVNYPPKVSISTLVNSLKGVSSRMLRKKYYLEIQSKLIGKRKNLWSPSYFASSCGGAPINTIRKYIENQKTPS